jgi:hypothetical protein
VWLIGLFQILVPLIFIAIIAFQPQPNRWRWALNTLAYGLAITFMILSSRWDLVSIYLRILYPVLLAVAILISYKRTGSSGKPQSRIQAGLNISISVILIGLMGGLSWQPLKGYPTPPDAMDLVSPLRDGNYVVLHGGASPFINGHFKVRPQTFALDIVGLNNLGLRATAFSDMKKLENYEIYGASLFSPCNGTVAVAVDEYQDLVPPKTDPEHLAGNHILLECDGTEVLLAHLQKDSVNVSAGDTVTTATLLGKVGNTGNTSEPHLHLHAERDGEPGEILDGTAVPITIDGRFLVRGSLIMN